MLVHILMLATLAAAMEIHGMGFSENLDGIVHQYCRTFALLADTTKYISVKDIQLTEGGFPLKYGYKYKDIRVLHMQTIHNQCDSDDFTFSSLNDSLLISANTQYPGLYATIVFSYEFSINGMVASFGNATGYFGTKSIEFSCNFKTDMSTTQCKLLPHFEMGLISIKGVDATNDVKSRIMNGIQTNIFPLIQAVMAEYSPTFASNMILYDKYDTISLTSPFVQQPMSIVNKNPIVSYDNNTKMLLVSYNSEFIFNQISLVLPSSLLLRIPNDEYNVLISTHILDDIINHVGSIISFTTFYSYEGLSSLIGSQATYSLLKRMYIKEISQVPSYTQLQMACTPNTPFAANYIINSLFSFSYNCWVNPAYLSTLHFLEFSVTLIREISGDYDASNEQLHLSLSTVSEFEVTAKGLDSFTMFQLRNTIKKATANMGKVDLARISIPKPSDNSKFDIYAYLLDIAAICFETK